MILTMYVMQSHPDRHRRGMILGQLEVDTVDIPGSLPANVSVVNSVADFETEYCDGINILPRQAITATLGPETLIGSTVTLSGLTDPCMLYVNAVAIEVVGGSYDLLLDKAGDHIIEVNEATCELKRWVITAT